MVHAGEGANGAQRVCAATSCVGSTLTCRKPAAGQNWCMRLSSLLVLDGLVVLLACSNTERVEFDDEGSVCLRSTASGALSVEVSWWCFSSSCDHLVRKSCSMERGGREIILRSSAVVDREGGDCTDDCGIESTTCELPGVEAGEYVIRHGSEVATVNLGVGAAILLGDAGPAGTGSCQ